MIRESATIAVLAVALAGCVSSGGIQPDGPDGYRLVKVGKTGFSSSGTMQNENYQEASDFCSKQGKVVETISQDSKQARPMGGYPEAHLRFRCTARAH